MFQDVTAKYRIYLSLLMWFLIRIKGCANCCKTTSSVHKKCVFTRWIVSWAFSENDRITFKFNSPCINWSIPIPHLCLQITVSRFVICDLQRPRCASRCGTHFCVSARHNFLAHRRRILKLVSKKYSARPQVLINSCHLERHRPCGCWGCCSEIQEEVPEESLKGGATSLFKEDPLCLVADVGNVSMA
jgi:hypothetical protein